MNKNSNLLYVCKSMPQQYKGGIQVHTLDLAHQMANLGFNVSILTAGNRLFRNTKVKVNRIEYILLRYLPGRHIPILWLFLEEFFFNLSVLLWMYRHAQKYDIIHLEGRSGMFVPYLINHKRVYTTCHGLLQREMESTGKKASISQKIHYNLTLKVEKGYYRKARLIAVSESLKSDLKHLYGVKKPIQVIPNGVHIPSVFKGQKLTPKIVFVGRIEHAKGIFDLLDSVPYLEPDIQLVIIGSGTEEAKLKVRINSDPILQSRVKYSGAGDRDKVIREISSSFTLVLPSYSETQGIVLLEANSFAKPVVATKIPGIVEVVTHEFNGLLVPVSNPYRIGQAVNRLYLNSEEAYTLGMNGRKTVEQKFSWQVVSQQFHSLYTSNQE